MLHLMARFTYGTCLVLPLFSYQAQSLYPYVRNNGNVTYATYFMVIGFVMNIVLDYVLIIIFPFGIHGAAIATLLSQAVTIVGCIYYIKQHQMLKLSKPVNVQKTSLKIMKIVLRRLVSICHLWSLSFFMNAIHFIMAEL